MCFHFSILVNSFFVNQMIIRTNPDVEWWSHVLSWNETYGSGARSWWSGWMIDFLMAGRWKVIIAYWFLLVFPNQRGETPELPEWDDVSPCDDSWRRSRRGFWQRQNRCRHCWLHNQGKRKSGHLLDNLQRDNFSSGLQGDRRPVVEARQAWGLIMPKGSVITPRLLGKA